MPYIDFNRQYFLEGVKAVNPSIPVFEVSCKTGDGFDAVVKWLLGSSTYLR
jgi:hydrogenase nickel incorporation protein HypB